VNAFSDELKAKLDKKYAALIKDVPGARSEATHDSRLNLTLWKSLSSHLSHLAQEFYPFFDNFVLLCRAR